MSSQTRYTRAKRSVLSAHAMAVAIAVAVMVTAPMAANVAATEMSDTKSMTAAPMDHSKMDCMKPMDGMKHMDGMTHKNGMKHMDCMSRTGDTDYDFAANMRMHHQMAVDMSEAELKNGKDPQMLKMAKDIIAAQKQEIAVFDTWLKAHPQAVPAAMPLAK